jgi:hypothetical protein
MKSAYPYVVLGVLCKLRGMLEMSGRVRVVRTGDSVLILERQSTDAMGQTGWVLDGSRDLRAQIMEDLHERDDAQETTDIAIIAALLDKLSELSRPSLIWTMRQLQASEKLMKAAEAYTKDRPGLTQLPPCDSELELKRCAREWGEACAAAVGVKS